MSTMIETVAKAIYDKFEDRPQYAKRQMNGILAQELARAAIEAMREPSEAQVETLTHIIRRSAWGRENVIKQYRELIDAALSGDA